MTSGRERAVARYRAARSSQQRTRRTITPTRRASPRGARGRRDGGREPCHLAERFVSPRGECISLCVRTAQVVGARPVFLNIARTVGCREGGEEPPVKQPLWLGNGARGDYGVTEVAVCGADGRGQVAAGQGSREKHQCTFKDTIWSTISSVFVSTSRVTGGGVARRARADRRSADRSDRHGNSRIRIAVQ